MERLTGALLADIVQGMIHDILAGLGVLLQLLCSTCQIFQLSLVVPDVNLQQMMFQVWY